MWLLKSQICGLFIKIDNEKREPSVKALCGLIKTQSSVNLTLGLL